MEDSLKVSDSEKGGLVVEWDPNDPRYEFLNHLSEDQVNAILKESFIRALENIE